MACLEPQAKQVKVCVIKVLNSNMLAEIETRFPDSTLVDSRVAASHQGRSHSQVVEGNALMIQHINWEKPRVAFSKDGSHWQSDEIVGELLVIVENLQNFIFYEETLSLVIEDCGLAATPEEVTLLFGSGNAAAKTCNRTLFRQYSEVYTLFDLDPGGINTYGNIKIMLAEDGMQPNFLAPKNIEAYLERSQWMLNNEERTSIYHAGIKHPELSPLLQCLYTSGKKLEQETYLDRIYG
ncbi:hypothetical protein [Microbulbifer sp. JMSA003]|uniref:hypothetical protein n=1 Tax=Microbulbifer sp. JMSA003 TaxID=3243369 RepID=UPI0040392BF7